MTENRDLGTRRIELIQTDGEKDQIAIDGSIAYIDKCDSERLREEFDQGAW